jgi:hypothetical protein
MITPLPGFGDRFTTELYKKHRSNTLFGKNPSTPESNSQEVMGLGILLTLGN